MKISRRIRNISISLLVVVLALGCGWLVKNSFSQVFADGTYTAYLIDDYLYYDPVTGNECNENNYWGVYNQDTTCYRWFMLTQNDTSAKSSLRLVLDHDIAFDTWSQIDTHIGAIRSQWTRYAGEITVATEDEIDDAMGLTLRGVARPTLENISVNAGFANYRLAANTIYYNDGAVRDDYGWWSGTSYPADNSYAYTITEYGNNRLVPKTSSRGIRPVIELQKSEVVRGSRLEDITNLVSSANKNEFAKQYYADANYDYAQLQGFTTYSDKIVYYSSSHVSNWGMLFGRYGSNFNSVMPGTPSYVDGGHGNDMTYNSSDNLAVVIGPNSYKDAWLLNGNTLAYEGKIDVYEKTGLRIYAAAYDNRQNQYIGMMDARRAYFFTADSGVKYSFDMPFDETSQGMEYHNGYLYVTTYIGNCPSSYISTCIGYPAGSGVINVYDARFGNDGKPVKSFGRLVKRFYIGTTFGELESISFNGDKVYLGYSAQSAPDYDGQLSFRFYSFGSSAISAPMTFTLDYSLNGGSGAPKSHSCTTTGTSCAVAISGVAPTRAGYTFLGWADSASATSASYQPGGSITLSGDKTIYAVWRLNSVTRTLTFNANNGTGAPANQTCTATGTATSCAITISSTAPTRAGYTFLGWADSASATSASYQPGGSITLSGDKIIYAVWEKIIYDQTVSFAITSVNKIYGDSVFTNLATTTGDGTITYTSNNTNVAIVDSNTGAVTINGVGTATITATASATADYNQGFASYTLTVAKKTSIIPEEAKEPRKGWITDTLSTITLDVDGLAWDNPETIIEEGSHFYRAKYTTNNDTTNYTTEYLDITVLGEHRIYTVVEGDGQTYQLNKETGDMVFKIDADYSLFERGGFVYIDEELLDKQFYDSESGSTIINIHHDYLKTLETGEHTLAIAFNDGGIATARFIIAEKEKEKEKEPIAAPDSGGAITNGDNAWSMPCLVSVLFIMVGGSRYFILAKKKHRKFD